MKSKTLELTNYPLTADKAAHICARDGYTVSGVVLRKPNGDCCIVDGGAVRWLTQQQALALMHPDPI